jgi:cell division protein FtsA
MVEVDETVGIKVIGQAREARMPRREICQAVKERAVELLQFIRAKLEEASLEGVPDARIVLTGGAANLPGLDQLARRVLSASVRIGVPVRPDGISEELRNPSYSTSVGILLWSLEDALQWSTSSNGHKTSEGLYNRLLGWFLGRVKSVVPA